MNVPTKPAFTITLTMLFMVGIFIQFLSFLPLWGHESRGGIILARYSISYGIALLGSAVIAGAWLIGLFRRQRILDAVQRTSPQNIIAFILLSGIAVLFVWMSSVENQIHYYIALNWLVLVSILIICLPDQPVNIRRWRWILIGGLLLLLVPILVTSLTGKTFNPDEAHWADYATSPFVAGGMYSRTWLNEPQVINPGLGWSVAAYGWLLENIAFDIRVGRIFNAVMVVLAFAGVGVVANRLYGRTVAAISVAFGILSQVFFPVMDYRPDQQLPALMMLIVYCLLRAQSGTRRYGWDIAVGLLVTLSLELHAVAIVYAVGFAIYYVVRAALSFYRIRDFALLKPIIAFAIGAGIGTGIFLVFNVFPIGGMQAYIDGLLGERFSGELFGFWEERFQWVSFMEATLLLLGFLYLLWRRQKEDRFLLGVYAPILLSAILLDSWGYRTVHQALYLIPIAVLLVDGFRSSEHLRGHNRHSIWIAAAVLVMMAGQAAGETIRWNDVQSFVQRGELPTPLDVLIGGEIAPYITEEDVVVSTHLLLWAFPDHPHLYSVSGEVTAQRRWEYANPVDVWNRIQPTVVVDVRGRMVLTEGIQQYMEQENFTVCRRLVADRTNILIYRTMCDEE